MPPGLTSPIHLAVILFVALIVLGPDKLPVAIRQVGKAIGELRRWSESISSEVRDALDLDADTDGDPSATTAPVATPGAPPPVIGPAVASTPAALPAAPSPNGSAPIEATATPVPLDAAATRAPANGSTTSSAAEWGLVRPSTATEADSAEADSGNADRDDAGNGEAGNGENNGHHPAHQPGGEWS